MDPVVTVTFELHEDQQLTTEPDGTENSYYILHTTVEFGGITTKLDPVCYGGDHGAYGKVEAKDTMTLIKEVLRLACPTSEFWIQGNLNTSPLPGS